MVLRRARLELDAVPRAATSEGLGDVGRYGHVRIWVGTGGS
jgi:hypothetical protein